MSSTSLKKPRNSRCLKGIALVEEIWDSIAEDNGCFELTDAQKQELDRRVNSSGHGRPHRQVIHESVLLHRSRRPLHYLHFAAMARATFVS